MSRSFSLRANIKGGTALLQEAFHPFISRKRRVFSAGAHRSKPSAAPLSQDIFRGLSLENGFVITAEPNRFSPGPVMPDSSFLGQNTHWQRLRGFF